METKEVQLVILHALLSAGAGPEDVLKFSRELAQKFMEQEDDIDS